jgi:hypothetical protein
MPFISITRLRVRSVRFLPLFVLFTFGLYAKSKLLPVFRMEVYWRIETGPSGP